MKRFGAELVSLWLLAFLTASLIGTHGIAYWDAGDYVLLAVQGGKSGLLLGRPLFLWISRAVLSLGVDPAQAEPVLRWFWAALGALAAPALAILASRLGLTRNAALMAGATLALSPSFAHTSHQVLTDAPALALSIASLTCAASGRAILSGLLLAAAIATRETAAVNFVALFLLLGWRRGLVAVASCAIALAAMLVIYQPPGLSWLQSMSRSVASHPYSVRDFLTSVVWVLAAGPIPVIVGLIALAKRTNRDTDRRLRIVAVPAAAATAALLFYPDGSFSPRYVLATVPLAFFLPAAASLAKRPVMAGVAFVVTLAAGAVAVYPANMVAAYGTSVMKRIPKLPPAALVVPGHFCPQARLAAAAAKRTDLEFICTGWDWPPDLSAKLESAVQSGRPVAVDEASAAWVGPREVEPHRAVQDWISSRTSEEIAAYRIVKR